MKKQLDNDLLLYSDVGKSRRKTKLSSNLKIFNNEKL